MTGIGGKAGELAIRDATAADAAAICAIYNHAVRETTAIWNDVEVDAANRAAWLAERQGAGFPVLVAERAGALAGYATYGPFRPHDGYRFTVENSVYVAETARGGGVGRALMEALVARARKAGLHAMIAGIEAENASSIRLHASLGFVEAGRLPQVGTKFGRWLDLLFMQLTLADSAPR
ncbi:MAG TPA: N-acetyltransferase family protein [Rhodoblastus sp.]|nr:N-acetyltransferase family protein [Rhodoblastus sp.]